MEPVPSIVDEKYWSEIDACYKHTAVQQYFPPYFLFTDPPDIRAVKKNSCAGAFRMVWAEQNKKWEIDDKN